MDDDDDDAVAALRAASVPLVGPPAAWAAQVLDRVVDRARTRLVLIGEATHGTHEFYEARHAMTQRLLTDYNFSGVVLAADWPSTAAVRADRGRNPVRARRG